MNKEALRKQSGRRDLDPVEVRDYCASVRLNPQELSQLDAVRGKHQRGEALRMLALTSLPAPVPAINADLRADLGRALGNIATLAIAMRAGDYAQIDDIKSVIFEAREKLGGIVK